MGLPRIQSAILVNTKLLYGALYVALVKDQMSEIFFVKSALIVTAWQIPP